MLSGTWDPDVFEALARYCAAHPRQSRSAVLTWALRQLLLPEYQEERERVLAENLDRMYWHAHNHAERVNRDLRVLTEMLALGVRTFYNHTPAVPEGMRGGGGGRRGGPVRPLPGGRGRARRPRPLGPGADARAGRGHRRRGRAGRGRTPNRRTRGGKP